MVSKINKLITSSKQYLEWNIPGGLLIDEDIANVAVLWCGPLLDDAGSSLTGESKDPVLSAGQTSLPFVCRLLAELPSSFEGRYGQVSYEAQAIITQSTNNKSTDVVVKRPFTVMCGLDLSFVSEASVYFSFVCVSSNNLF